MSTRVHLNGFVRGNNVVAACLLRHSRSDTAAHWLIENKPGARTPGQFTFNTRREQITVIHPSLQRTDKVYPESNLQSNITQKHRSSHRRRVPTNSQAVLEDAHIQTYAPAIVAREDVTQSTTDGAPPRSKTGPIREAYEPQDAHTYTERTLLEKLWRWKIPGTYEHKSSHVHIVRAGEREIARAIGMAYSTVQKNLRSLKKKLAIDIQPNGTNKRKTYVVYGFGEIKRRRKAAGLMQITKRTNSIGFVDPRYPTPSDGAPPPSKLHRVSVHLPRHPVSAGRHQR